MITYVSPFSTLMFKWITARYQFMIKEIFIETKSSDVSFNFKCNKVSIKWIGNYEKNNQLGKWEADKLTESIMSWHETIWDN